MYGESLIFTIIFFGFLLLSDSHNMPHYHYTTFCFICQHTKLLDLQYNLGYTITKKCKIHSDPSGVNRQLSGCLQINNQPPNQGEPPLAIRLTHKTLSKAVARIVQYVYITRSLIFGGFCIAVYNCMERLVILAFRYFRKSHGSK